MARITKDNMDETFRQNLEEAIRLHKREADLAQNLARRLKALERTTEATGRVQEYQIRDVAKVAENLTACEEDARQYFSNLGELVEEFGLARHR